MPGRFSPTTSPRRSPARCKAYHADSALVAQAQLEALAKELERTHPGAPDHCAKACPRH